MDGERAYLRGARRKARAARDYFDDDDDDLDSSSTSYQQQQPSLSSSSASAAANHDDEVDPLDAFMMGIETQVVQERAQQKATAFAKPDVLNHDDEADAYLDDYARSNGLAGADDSDDEVYAAAKRADPDGAPDTGDGKKTMEVLAPVDHTQIQYESFRKCFYTPHADIAAMTEADVAALRRELAVRVDETDAPRPVQSFMHLGIDRKLLARLLQLGLEAPTAIQAQAFPVALAGRDMIGIAKTGSGKTLAFTLPMVRHVMDQRALSKGDGPIAVVLAPTRELAHQIFTQVKRFTSAIGGECAAIYGGVGKWEQIQAVRRGAEVVVATPGRLIELIRKRTVAMSRVTFVVLDEADRMFEMGFEPQLRSVLSQIRPDRQTLLFSATFQRRIEALARDVLCDPVKVTVGHVGQANEEIRQVAVVVPNDSAKWPWLRAHLPRIAADGRVLIFAASKLGCETLAKNVGAAMGVATACLHGDKTQQERSDALSQFKTGACRVLVATDVAARGLDVKDIKTVVNFDVAKTIDIHVHRIGRTGRMGLDGFEPGTAYTLVTMKESVFAAQLVHNMDVSKQPVAPDLLALASRDARFRRRGPGSGAAATAQGPAPTTHERGTSGSREYGGDDAERDAEEMERWHESRRASQATQRKGLGFAGAAGATGRAFHGGRGGGRMASAASLSSSFQSAFVKSTAAASAAPRAAPVETAPSHGASPSLRQPPPTSEWSAPPPVQASVPAPTPPPPAAPPVPPSQPPAPLLAPERTSGTGAQAIIHSASGAAPAAPVRDDDAPPAAQSASQSEQLALVVQESATEVVLVVVVLVGIVCGVVLSPKTSQPQQESRAPTPPQSQSEPQSRAPATPSQSEPQSQPSTTALALVRSPSAPVISRLVAPTVRAAEREVDEQGPKRPAAARAAPFTSITTIYRIHRD